MTFSLSSRQRLELSRLISGLPEAQFEQLRFALNPPPGILPAGSSAQGNRGIALLEWAGGPTGPGVSNVLGILNDIAPGTFKLDAQSLLPIFQGSELALTEAIQTAYRLVCPLNSKVPATLSAMLDQLGDVKPGDSLFEAVDRFAALLSLPDLNSRVDIQEALQGWLKPRVSNFDALIADVKPLLVKHLEQQARGGTSHLLVYVQKEVEDGRLVSAYFIQDDSQYDIRGGKGIEKLDAPEVEPFLNQVTRESLPRLVQACISETLEKSHEDLTLHLILPLAWLNETCDRWSAMDCSDSPFLPDVRVGVRFRCVVRMAERLEPKVLNMFKEPWQKKWSTLLDTVAEGVCGAFVLADDLPLATELFERLNRPTSVGLKMSKVYDDSGYERLFGTLIATGTPAALWLRNDQLAETVCATNELDRVLTCTSATLPEVVKLWRSAAMAVADETAHIGHHLSCLWENPNLIPPLKPSLRMPRP
ncbi:hypothetical protein [Nodosilinea sp. P-1105]|uniref:VMAP-C domain-containing protein n=1 Tax=Nodosilinea sp. P-1105 TaxID=2546229 RepID=UPI00146E6755|nr:hypothetical protein [Nodosilinea sp. P-1105]NMF84644.1 hypothetical protein [Nodosilinea sp. P-1105]